MRRKTQNLNKTQSNWRKFPGSNYRWERYYFLQSQNFTPFTGRFDQLGPNYSNDFGFDCVFWAVTKESLKDFEFCHNQPLDW